jgi:hypothetical protein
LAGHLVTLSLSKDGAQQAFSIAPCHPEPVEGWLRDHSVAKCHTVGTTIPYDECMPRKLYDWKAVQAYYDDGHGVIECSRQFGFTYGAWTKAVKRGALHLRPARFEDLRCRYDWAEIQAYYDTGASFRKCSARFGFHAAAWGKAVRRGKIKPRPSGMPLETLLRSGKSRYNIKHRLIRAGLLENRCQECGLSEWRGRPLMAHIDHINGIKDDHRLENLRMLCPNCHSQTDTYGGHNARRRRELQEPAQLM